MPVATRLVIVSRPCQKIELGNNFLKKNYKHSCECSGYVLEANQQYSLQLYDLEEASFTSSDFVILI